MENWYKISRLLDVETSPDKDPINLSCMYCGRIGTHPSELNPSRDKVVWKKEKELSTEEVEEYGNVGRISHGICYICKHLSKALTQTMGHGFDIEELKRMSLEI